jgi:hypothetical protein
MTFLRFYQYLVFIFLMALLFLGNLAIAAENEEIEFLLSYVANSDCTFLRNGDPHEAQEASKHLERKYNHVRSRIKTAEDFIVKIASKSSLSGRLYEVRCANEQLPTKQWLRKALASHRVLAEQHGKEIKIEGVE